jgi:hypothetical protein
MHVQARHDSRDGVCTAIDAVDEDQVVALGPA